jgi:hypothetical protein
MSIISIEALLDAMCFTLEYSTKKELNEAIRLIDDVLKFSGAQTSTLIALHDSGPLFDGDVPSKCGRDLLVEGGYAAIIIAKGQEGYNACTQKGHYAKLVLDEIDRQCAKTNKGTTVPIEDEQ